MAYAQYEWHPHRHTLLDILALSTNSEQKSASTPRFAISAGLLLCFLFAALYLRHAVHLYVLDLNHSRLKLVAGPELNIKAQLPRDACEFLRLYLCFFNACF